MPRARGSGRRRSSGPSRAAAPPDDLDLGSDKLYFKIGEVAEIVGVPAYVLRYWETEFRAVKPQKSRTQQRVYRRRDVATLLRIKHLLYAQKFTIAGARQQLKETPDAGPMAPPDGLYLCRQSLAKVRDLCRQTRRLLDGSDGSDRAAADPAAYVAAAGGAQAILEGREAPSLVARPARSSR